MPQDSEPEFLSVVREQLRYWPYSLHQIEDTLDLGLIEGKAKQILFQSLNTRSLCGFAGSGLSAAYGRLSWGEWKKEQLAVVERNGTAFLDLAKASRNWIEILIRTVRATKNPAEETGTDAPWVENVRTRMDPNVVSDKDSKKQRQKDRHNAWRWLRTRLRAVSYAEHEIRQLYTTFRKATSDEGTFPGGEALPVQFEIAQQLHDQIRRHLPLFSDFSAHADPQRPSVTDNDELEDQLKDKFWAGSNQSDESAAPVSALNILGNVIQDVQNSETILSTNGPKVGEGYKEKWLNFNKVSGQRASRLSFEMLTKVLLVDECGHASILLRNGLTREDDDDNEKNLTRLDNELNLYDPTKLKRDLNGIRDDPSRYRVLSPFRKETLDELNALLDEQKNKLDGKTAAWAWQDMRNHIKETLDEYFGLSDQTGDKRRFLTPTSRFLLSVYLRLICEPFAALKGDKDRCLSILKDPETTDFTSRRSIIADRLDPLAKAIRDLGVTQFITTNYDFEIERFFQDAGYRKFGATAPDERVLPGQEPKAGPDDFRHDPLGNVLIDRTFKRDRAADLISFAMDGRKTTGSVFHLHGRATQDDGLVISERDYMDLYLTEDENRDSVDEAISVAFSSMPILFLGLGMTETDMLRPLRQFISNRDRAVAYNSIALLPAEKNFDERVKTSTALYLRYGVHTIFFGSGQIEVEVSDETGSRKEPCGIDWLHRILALRGAVEKQIDDWVKKLNEDKTKFPELDNGWERAFLNEIDKAVGELGEDLEIPNTFSAKLPALNVLMGKTGEKFEASEMLTALKEPEPAFKVPVFTPIRPKASGINSQHFNKTVNVYGKEYIGFYLLLLEKLLRMMVGASPFALPSGDGANLDDRRAVAADLEARKLMASGLIGGFVGGSLNAALDGINREWRLWWRNWQKPPKNRTAVFETMSNLPVENDTGDDLAKTNQLNAERANRRALWFPVRRIRHLVDNSITILTEAERCTCPKALELNDRFKLMPGLMTRIRAYDTFVAAVAAQWMKDKNQPAAWLKTRRGRPKRRFYTVAALRGHGKGTFINAMNSRLGLSLYIRAAWPENGIKIDGIMEFSPENWTEPKIVFPTAIFINYTFSSEVASTFDMTVDSIVEAASRIEALVTLWDDIPPTVHGRVVRATLEAQEPGRRTKTYPEWISVRDRANKIESEAREDLDKLSRLSQIRRALKRFKAVSDQFHDITTSAGEGIQPRLFLCIHASEVLFRDDARAKNGEIARIILFLTGKKAKNHPMDLIFIGSERGLGSPWGTVEGKDGAPDNTQLRLARIDRIGMPESAREHVKRRIDAGRIRVLKRLAARKRDGFVHFARPVSPIEMMVSNFPTLARALFLLDPPAGSVAPDETWWNNLDLRLREARKFEADQITLIWRKQSVPSPEEVCAARAKARSALDLVMDTTICEMGISAKLKYGGADRVKECLRGRYKVTGGHHARDWQLVRQYLSGNRFCLTILLAAAQHIVENASDMRKGAQEAERFIQSTVDQVRNVGEHRKEDLVLSTVLELYRRYQVIGQPDSDTDLHLLILRHLAVIGTPVSSSVLVRLPEFREYFARLKEAPEVSRRRTVVRALTTLCGRGLVFRLSPHPSLVKLGKRIKRDWPFRLDYRYTLHRVVQRHGMSLLGQGRSDPVRSNPFAPTLYGAMPSGGPRLNREAYVFLRRLMVGLSQYPDISQAEGRLEPWLFTTTNTEVAVQALRASLSLARASFSVAIISRFADYRQLIPGSERRGYLETYKVRLRWILRKAWELERSWTKEDIETIGLESPGFNALYRDEVVWLYNELGVTSLAQGSLSDSLALLRQAAEFNNHIEGRDLNGPISNMISLNHAVVQMERGRLVSARNRLETVTKATAKRAGTVNYLAQGYLCVLDHLTGRTQQLKKRFATATDFFQAAGEKRAASTLLHHRARFLRESDPDLALQLLATARRLAETGGHEDIRHHIQIAELLVGLSMDGPSAHVGPGVFEQVREIERFGRHMGIWSLQVDALILKARLLIEQGETTSSGKLLGRAMAISHRFSMVLRCNRALTIYADLLHRRGDLQGAKSVGVMSLELARISGFSLETVRAQRVLSKIGTASPLLPA